MAHFVPPMFAAASGGPQEEDVVLVDMITRMRSGDESLQEIRLHGAKIGGDTLRNFANALHSHASHITVLDLKYCFVEGGIRKLLRTNENDECTAAATSIPSMSFQFCGVDDDDAEALATILTAKDCNVVDLHLGKGCIMTTSGIHHIAQALSINTSVKELDLSGSGIGDYGALVLGMALQHNSTLTSLSLQRTLVSNVGVKRLASVLRENTTLSRLDLSHTLVRLEGIQAVARVLERQNTSLMHVVLTKRNPNKSKCRDEERIQHYTSQNRAGRGLLQDPATPASLAPVLLEKATDNVKTLYGLLRELPQLWTIAATTTRTPTPVVAV